MVYIDISNSVYFIQHIIDSDISEVYNIGLQRYENKKIRVCGKVFVKVLYKMEADHVTSMDVFSLLKYIAQQKTLEEQIHERQTLTSR